MKAYSVDLRERVLAAVDAKEGTLIEIAQRFRVSASGSVDSGSSNISAIVQNDLQNHEIRGCTHGCTSCCPFVSMIVNDDDLYEMISLWKLFPKSAQKNTLNLIRELNRIVVESGGNLTRIPICATLMRQST